MTACSAWKPAAGGAWPWCDECGVRADLHPGSPVAGAVARIVRRAANPGEGTE